LCSNGYYYNSSSKIDECDVVKWRCEQYRAPSVVKKSGCSSCPATGESEGLKPPFNLKIAHNHIPVFTRLNQLKKYEVIITILFLLFKFMV